MNLIQVVDDIPERIGIGVRQAVELRNEGEVGEERRTLDAAEAEVGNQTAGIGVGIEERNLEIGSSPKIGAAGSGRNVGNTVLRITVLEFVGQGGADDGGDVGGEVRPRESFGEKRGEREHVGFRAGAVGVVLRVVAYQAAEEGVPLIVDVVIDAVDLIELG